MSCSLVAVVIVVVMWCGVVSCNVVVVVMWCGVVLCNVVVVVM